MFATGHSLRRPLVIGKSFLGLYILDKGNVQVLDTQVKEKQVVVNCVRESLCENKTLYDCNAVTAMSHFNVWRNRLGHMFVRKMSVVSQLVKFHHNGKDFVCEICPKAKQHRLPFPTSHNSTSSIFELLYVDTWGPYHAKTHVGHRYFLTIVDDYPRGTWTHLMVTKDEAFTLIKSFINMAKTQFGKVVKIIRSDNALKLGRSSKALNFFAETVIKHETSCVHTSQQNGAVERKHKHLFEVSRALMFQASMPLKY